MQLRPGLGPRFCCHFMPSRQCFQTGPSYLGLFQDLSHTPVVFRLFKEGVWIPRHTMCMQINSLTPTPNTATNITVFSMKPLWCNGERCCTADPKVYGSSPSSAKNIFFIFIQYNCIFHVFSLHLDQQMTFCFVFYIFIHYSVIFHVFFFNLSCFLWPVLPFSFLISFFIFTKYSCIFHVFSFHLDQQCVILMNKLEGQSAESIPSHLQPVNTFSIYLTWQISNNRPGLVLSCTFTQLYPHGPCNIVYMPSRFRRNRSSTFRDIRHCISGHSLNMAFSHNRPVLGLECTFHRYVPKWSLYYSEHVQHFSLKYIESSLRNKYL